jgi:kynureninase
MNTQTETTNAVARLGDGPLTESGVVEHLHPLFLRMLSRNERTGEIYLANHSLGRPMDAVSVEVARQLDAWYDDLDGAWDPWIDLRDQFRKSIARIISCSQWDAVVPKTSAGQGLRAVINALPRNQQTKHNIVATRGEFDSVDFILKANAHKGIAEICWVDSNKDGLYCPDDIISQITNQTDLVVFSMVGFVTGQLMDDIDRIIETAHRNNALVLIDAYHAFGTIPIEFDQLDADFLVAGSYKYIRGGAGACFLVINPRHLSTEGGIPKQDDLFTTDTGWFAKKDTFAYGRSDEPEFAPGGDAWLESTPPPLVYAQANPGLHLVAEIGVERLRTYSLDQQDFLCDQLRKNNIEPRVLDLHGAFVLIPSADGQSAIKALKASGVNADARPCPRTGEWMIRLCPDLLNTRAELTQAAHRIGQALA